MKLLLFCLISILLFSCASPDRTGQIETLKVLQTAVQFEFANGEQRLGTMKDILADKSRPEGMTSRMGNMLSAMENIDSISSYLMQKMNGLRSQVLNQKATNKERPNRPIELEYSPNLTFHKRSLPEEKEIKTIMKEIEKYRNELCRIIVKSNVPRTGKSEKHFSTPKLSKFENEEQKTKSIDYALKKSDMYDEDLYGVRQIMLILSKQNETWQAMLTNNENWVDFSMSILSIQNLILQARTRAFYTIQMRYTNCREYYFTEMKPIIVGSSNALPNDTVQFQVYLGAYDEYTERDYTVAKGATVKKTDDGKGLIETVVPASGEIEVKGDIIYQLKNGDIRKYPWSHNIRVIKEN